jgi:NTE family protein
MELPPHRFATGIAVSGCFRQIGAVVGIAGLVAVLHSAGTLRSFHEAWTLIAICGLAAAIAGLALGRIPRPNPVQAGAATVPQT